MSMLLPVLVGCNDQPQQTQTTGTTDPTGSAQKTDTLRILIIGNSHSVDTFQFLAEAFRDQLPEQNIVAASLYYSGCSINMHNSFAANEEPVYRFTMNKNGKVTVMHNVTMQTGLQAQRWDIIMLQGAKSDLDNTLNRTGRRLLEEIVADNVAQPYTLAWHTTWPSPNDETFFSPDWVRQPPEGYKDDLIRLYGFDPITQFGVLTQKAKDNILSDDTYAYKICTGAAIMQAHYVQNIPQLEIWRDYTHLSDYGRLIAAYSMYAQLTGNKITAINMDEIPVAKRHEQFKAEGDLTVTDEMKQAIMEAANHSLDDPWTVPGQN